jgi:hypothetical protein
VGVAVDDDREKAQAVEREREVTLSARELLKLSRNYGRKTKFRNVPTEVDGIKFDSRAEARRYGELKLMERADAIRALRIHPDFELSVNGMDICKYVADFSYYEPQKAGWIHVVEDVKSKATKTPTYRLKRKLMEAVFGISIREVL